MGLPGVPEQWIDLAKMPAGHKIEARAAALRDEAIERRPAGYSSPNVTSAGGPTI